MIKKLYRKYKEIINYIIVGAITTLVSILSYACFRCVINNIYVNTTLSWIMAVTFAYFANRKYVFNSKKEKALKEFVSFVTCRVATLIMENLFMFLLVDLININDMISKIIVQFLILISNYIFSKFFVFKKS